MKGASVECSLLVDEGQAEARAVGCCVGPAGEALEGVSAHTLGDVGAVVRDADSAYSGYTNVCWNPPERAHIHVVATTAAIGRMPMTSAMSAGAREAPVVPDRESVAEGHATNVVVDLVTLIRELRDIQS